MAVSKAEIFLAPEVRLAAYNKALSHPARIAVLKLLAERGACTCGEIVDVLPLAQATVSQHLRVLREAGLIRAAPDGPRTSYSADPEALEGYRRTMLYLFARLLPAPADAPKPL